MTKSLSDEDIQRIAEALAHKLAQLQPIYVPWQYAPAWPRPYNPYTYPTITWGTTTP
jgi:hypothetical protein